MLPVKLRLSQAVLLSAALLGLAGAVTVQLRAAPFPYVRLVQAAPKPRPGEATALTIETARGPLRLTVRQLQAMPTVRYATLHPQLGRRFVYEGVPLRDLAARGGFAGQDVRVSATNGFAATIRASDYLQFPVMLAYRADGHAISTLEKGPLTVVLPPEPARFHSTGYSAAWVWYAERLAPAP
ncbi:hypothetical protein [Deinococcus arboris]|uniref:hypothetical protein n=1 Tax=Deinococcus arboris TaxID=2682977 RepID=UPI0034E2E5BD